MGNKYLEKAAKIEIKPSHEGLLHKKLGLSKDKKIGTGTLKAEKEKAKATGNTKLEKEVVFAENAKKWRKG